MALEPDHLHAGHAKFLAVPVMLPVSFRAAAVVARLYPPPPWNGPMLIPPWPPADSLVCSDTNSPNPDACPTDNFKLRMNTTAVGYAGMSPLEGLPPVAHTLILRFGVGLIETPRFAQQEGRLEPRTDDRHLADLEAEA